MFLEIGIDEVGRGPLAGPVLVSALHIKKGARLYNPSGGTLRDSKQLTERQRDAWFDYLKSHPKVSFAVARVQPKTIDRINIFRAANRAAERACMKLVGSLGVSPKSCRVFLDGGLWLGKSKNGKHKTGARVKVVIGGDEKLKPIQAASIMAKVTRDRYMKKLAKRFPNYGFEIHKGYATKMHRAAIKRFGPSEVHRATFIS